MRRFSACTPSLGLLDDLQVADCLRRPERHAFILLFHAAQALEDALPLAQEDGHLDQIQLVDQAGLQVLAHGGRPAADADVLALGRRECLLQGGLDAVVDEREASTADPKCLPYALPSLC